MSNEAKTVDGMTVEQWLAIRKEAALQVDPETAEVMCRYVDVLDPYGLYPDDDCNSGCIGNVYFVRPSGSDVWVVDADLPKATWSALVEKMKARREFPEPTVYRRARELLIESADQQRFVLVSIEQAPKLIEKMRSALKESSRRASPD
jgi:hypothetical protein